MCIMKSERATGKRARGSVEFGLNGWKVGLRIITVLVIEHYSIATCALPSFIEK